MDNQTIYSAILDVMADVDAISKDKTNQKQNFKYRGVDDVLNVMHPLFAKHGILVVPTVIDQTREAKASSSGGVLSYSILKIKYTFFARDGSYIDAVVVGEGMDIGDKASNKAMSVAFKYACFQIFCIPTEDMVDPDGDSPSAGPPVITCQCCGKPITPAKRPSGKDMPAQEVAESTYKKYGKQMCVTCAENAGKAIQ